MLSKKTTNDQIVDDYTRKQLYWDNFYANSKLRIPSYPSQFATFVVNELPHVKKILEVGSGNGRDCGFFSLYNFDVLAIDSSPEVIEICRSQHRAPNLTFECHKVSDIEEIAQNFIANTAKSLIYGRFFLHAIFEDQQDKLLDIASRALLVGGHIAFEYRTIHDHDTDKVFDSHYRRFIDHEKLCRDIESLGFRIVYETEGTGLAKYKSEDAYVGRCIAKKV